MKKILALLLVVIMLLSLTACKSKEQKAADEFLKDMEKLIDEMIEAIEDEDEDALDELYEDLEKMGEDFAFFAHGMSDGFARAHDLTALFAERELELAVPDRARRFGLAILDRACRAHICAAQATDAECRRFIIRC